MDKSVDVFAKKIRADPNLKNGFNAIGFSQGNSLIRGYIQKYNDPPINYALHVHGTVSGVAGFPSVIPQALSAEVLHTCVVSSLTMSLYKVFYSKQIISGIQPKPTPLRIKSILSLPNGTTRVRQSMRCLKQIFSKQINLSW